MARIDIRKLDFSLLAVFLTLMRTRKTTVAADALGLTQSTVSHALARLRDVFDDPLFLRRPNGLEPTARALALEPRIREILDLAEAAIDDPVPFVPAEATGTVRIGVSDYAAAVLAPLLVAALRARAPGLTASFRYAIRGQAIDALGAGTLDLAVGFFWDAPAGIGIAPLVEEPYAVVLRPDHPARGPDGGLSVEDYANAPHALVSYEGDTQGIVDTALAARGFARKVVATVPFYLPGLALVAESDTLLTLPRRLAERWAPLLGLACLEPPVPIRPFRVSAAWHPRDEKSGLRIYVVDEIRRAFGLDPDRGGP